MSSELPAISVQDVSKHFRVFAKPADRLKAAVRHRIGGLAKLVPARLLGTEGASEFHALQHVSFHVQKGETIGIIGRNGSGKSTLLQIICGTLTPSGGRVAINGRVAALLELGAGFNPEFTGRENVFMNAALLGLSKAQIEERLDAIFAFADIGDFVDQPVKTYSSGMYVRLAFAVIAHVDADVLVIDEALAVGDAFFTQKCMRFLRAFMERGTVLFVSHDTNAVVNLCTRVVWLDKGRVREIGPAKDVCDSYLEAFYEEQHRASGRSAHAPERSSVVRAIAEGDMRDQRALLVNASKLRNDVELFQFTADAKNFGLGGASIEHVGIEDGTGASLNWVVGGEIVCIRIAVKALQNLQRAIVGFIVRDRLGQNLFGDNTYLTTLNEPFAVAAGESFSVRFGFRMPVLPVGDYSVTVAVADGSQSDHVIHQWLHDAVLLKSHSTSVSTGLIGIPMHEIVLERDTLSEIGAAQ
ncbi:ABC transporter ATP-binding protein [Burkholderia thailandensis]|uniref:ABC-2 transporter, ATP-binding protein n=2 Tax=Burkholderia thailandensis TaxID=57975 RepID=G3LYL5_BURTH|nr:ABC transporter ATP-binding protein [Burkholderia thailandensis]ABC39249.1 polysaccharide ABC transporter, ATP-binding protein [Burkholderia thailandensis E264]AEO78434.1 ABC-2 transporter, ATP-binding protein [Burkholderia thailandensis]AEO78450.1 polysaccharide ABC transporter, ATP-binding protein [Burkholderia thailandensis]AHI63104.1 ABC transporter family protein [Burkholderia thailandensis H0587]AHI72040.1 ABC transporter family protein [Burkholderia thailandensis 2002721723]